jgi:hypothetical protein
VGSRRLGRSAGGLELGGPHGQLLAGLIAARYGRIEQTAQSIAVLVGCLESWAGRNSTGTAAHRMGQSTPTAALRGTVKQTV